MGGNLKSVDTVFNKLAWIFFRLLTLVQAIREMKAIIDYIRLTPSRGQNNRKRLERY